MLLSQYMTNWDKSYQLNSFDGYLDADDQVFWDLSALEILNIKRLICLCFYADRARLHKHICAFASYFSTTASHKRQMEINT